ncbi:hypothetical protein V6N12_022511 [Hibiscus sabdariffa]|uniref:Uncharacterized protein n=1 Tax=Hibiscus sabdariffa TaxID=183260 RepID=A0ABR2FUW3_9ROSI
MSSGGLDNTILDVQKDISHNLRKVQSLRIATPRGVVAMMVDEEQKRWEDWRLREKTTPAANTSNDALALHALDGQ